MMIHLNGEPRETASHLSLTDLLRELGLEGRPVVVEHNGDALLPKEHAELTLAEGDRLEIVAITAGG